MPPLGFGGKRGGLSEPRHPLPCPGVPQPIWDQVRTVWPTDLRQRLGAAGSRQRLSSGLLRLFLLQAPAVYGRGVWLGRGEGAVSHPLRHHDREPQEGRGERYPTRPPSTRCTSAPSPTPQQHPRNCPHSSRDRCWLYHREAAHGAQASGSTVCLRVGCPCLSLQLYFLFCIMGLMVGHLLKDR